MDITRRTPTILVALILSAVVSPAAGRGSRGGDLAEIVPGESRKVLLDERAAGFRRSFRVHVPSAEAGDGPRPLVLALHGGFASGRILEKQSGLSAVADRHGFLVAYPNGLGFFGLARHWNGGYCCGKALKSDLDDLGFLDRVIAWVEARYDVDPRRIYIVGYSNGGMLAYWYAATRAEKLAGLGIWASSIGSLDHPERTWGLPPSTAPLPAFIAHGESDRRLPFEVDGARDGQRLLGAVGSAAAWAARNGCRDAPEIRAERDGAVEVRTWCAASAHPVVLVGVAGWGHDWPGPKRTGRLPASDALRGYDLAEAMWSWLGQHARPDPVRRGRGSPW